MAILNCSHCNKKLTSTPKYTMTYGGNVYYCTDCNAIFITSNGLFSEVIDYQQLKDELEHINEMLESLNHLRVIKDILEKKIAEVPKIYEIWRDNDGGSMTMNVTPDKLCERYIDKARAYERLNELNKGEGKTYPYYICESELNG